MVHRLKSIVFPQREQVWDRLNSSEKISFSLPHSGQVQMKELKFLSPWNPGQCVGVLVFCGMQSSFFLTHFCILVVLLENFKGRTRGKPRPTHIRNTFSHA